MERTSLSAVTSMSLHESQSRMWENLVGRGLPLWRFFYPRLQAAFPDQFGSVELDEYYRAINKVQPSLIRVEADEATYNLHIILRFELEQEILSGELALEDLPEAWNARMGEYLGIDVPDDAHGVLQDVHWSGGAIGYFPTYALGNVISVQLWDHLRAEIPDLDAQFEQGEFGELSAWLRENLHRHGRKYTSKEMLDRIVGGPMDPAPYLRYLREKLGEIYGLPVETGAAV
jgi:carboxypeptidase Taq